MRKGKGPTVLHRALLFNRSIGLKQRISTVFFTLGWVMSMLAFAYNAIVGMHLLINLPSLLTAIVCLVIPRFWKRSDYMPAQVSLCFLTFVYYPYMFFTNAGMDGSMPMYFILSAFMLSVIFEGKQRIWVTLASIAMYCAAIGVAIQHPELVVPYQNDFAKIIDFSVTMVLTLGVSAVIAYTVVYSNEQEHLRVTELLDQLQSKNEELTRQSIMDPLTLCYNRRYLFMCLEEEIKTHVANHLPLCALMMDIDHFKRINDIYGHSVGDEALRMTAETVRGILRKHDVLARYGGEEFVVLLPVCTVEDARQIAERVRLRISELCYRREVHFTISIGIGQLEPGDTPLVLIERADANMYAAKQAGRNQVVG